MCPAEAMLDSERIKPVVSAVIKLHLSEEISQSVTRKFCLIIKKNSLKMFQVNLKACLGLHNTASLSLGKREAGLWVMFSHVPCPNLVVSTIQYDYMIT